jgi:D-alanyl-D-alanine endopeptidase (penicillin-binding protein 7)
MPPLRLLLGLGLVTGIAAGITFYWTQAQAKAEERAAIEAEAADTEPDYIPASQIIEYGHPNRLALRSQVALIIDEREEVPLYERQIDTPRPIASLTKLMTALVIVEAGLPLDEPITITRDDRDRLKGTRSRLGFGAMFTRLDLLRAALGASDNRAAAALARSYPGGTDAFVETMNARAAALGMTNTRFADASGLNRHNVSTARDLARLVAAARREPLIEAATTAADFEIFDIQSERTVGFVNTNRLVRHSDWEIHLSKTGYTADAGNCLIMQVTVGERPLTVVLLNSWGKLSKYADARRIRDWLLKAERNIPAVAAI